MAPAMAEQFELSIDAMMLPAPHDLQPNTPDARTLPLWLTEREVEALVMLCAASGAYCGDIEDVLLGKIGEIFRAFHK
jgi:hypothetical protein